MHDDLASAWHAALQVPRLETRQRALDSSWLMNGFFLIQGLLRMGMSLMQAQLRRLRGALDRAWLLSYAQARDLRCAFLLRTPSGFRRVSTTPGRLPTVARPLQ